MVPTEFLLLSHTAPKSFSEVNGLRFSRFVLSVSFFQDSSIKHSDLPGERKSSLKSSFTFTFYLLSMHFRSPAKRPHTSFKF